MSRGAFLALRPEGPRYTPGRPVAPRSRPSRLADPPLENGEAVSSNVSQSYPYSSETEDERATAVATAVAAFDGLADRIRAESTPLGDVLSGEHGAPVTWWTWVCPRGDATGRLHVVGYARERHALVTVCDTCGATFLR